MIALGALALLLATPTAAYAYIDPGSGALLLQALAAAVVGVLFYVYRVLDRIKSWFRGQPKGDRNEQ